MQSTLVPIADLNKRLKELGWLTPQELTARVFEDVTGYSPNYIMVNIMKGEHVVCTFFLLKEAK